MRTFKCRGGLANDEPLQLELVATASDRRSSTQKELPLMFPRSRSGPVRYVYGRWASQSLGFYTSTPPKVNNCDGSKSRVPHSSQTSRGGQ